MPEVERYVREVERLERLLEGVAVERRRLKWYPLLGLALAPFGFFVGPWLAGALACSGFATAGVASYLAYVHHGEYAFLLERASARLRELRGEAPT